MGDLWLPDGSPKWRPGESSVQVEALKAAQSATNFDTRVVAVRRWEAAAIEDLEISLMMARDLAATKIEPHQQASAQDFLDQIGAIEAWWRVSISQQAKGPLVVF